MYILRVWTRPLATARRWVTATRPRRRATRATAARRATAAWRPTPPAWCPPPSPPCPPRRTRARWPPNGPMFSVWRLCAGPALDGRVRDVLSLRHRHHHRQPRQQPQAGHRQVGGQDQDTAGWRRGWLQKVCIITSFKAVLVCVGATWSPLCGAARPGFNCSKTFN